MKRALIAPSLLLGLFVGASGCVGIQESNSSSPAVPDKAESSPDKIADAQAALNSSNVRLDIAKMESVAFDAKQASREENAKVDLALAKQKLLQFDTYGKPSRMSQENLNLKSTKQSAAEAQEELEQIELMYKDQDLNDMTREFVVARGKRNAVRAQARIEIREANMASIFEHDLPMERTRLELSIEKANQALASLALEGEIGRRSKALKITEATASVEKAAKELAKLSEGASN